MALTNWAGNVEFAAASVHRPMTVEEVQELVAGAPAVRALGTGHSFSPIADSRGVLVAVDALDLPPVLDVEARTVTVGAGVRYAQLSRWLHASGCALHNLGSLPHLSVAGACATGTHGSGDGNGGLATAVAAVEMVTASGELVTVRRGADADFAGMVVSLGMLGVAVRVTLDVLPKYDVRQWVFDGLSWERLTERFDDVFAAGYSVSVFTGWRADQAGQLWVKRRADDPRGADPELFGARAADEQRHPIRGMPVENCTDQLGAPGQWHDRLPHFRAEFTPSAGDELQSEYLVPRRHAVAAVEALRRLGAQIAPVLQVGELRTVAADQLWLSPSYGTDVLGIHFTWVSDSAAVLPVMEAVEEALAPFGARPHWGKVFTVPPDRVRASYPRMTDFASLARRYDPHAKFRNDFVDRYIG
jgi:alditol oxidase